MRCSGSLGRAQRAWMFAVSILGWFVGLLVAVFAYYVQVELGETAARHGVAAGWSSSRDGRSAAGGWALAIIFVCGVFFNFFFGFWLAPLKQSAGASGSWPYRGRKAPTSEAKGCDPGRKAGLWNASVATALAAFTTFVVLGLPLMNPCNLPRAVYRIFTRYLSRFRRYRLRRQLTRQRAKWVIEEEARDALLETIPGARAAVCTLCRVTRADVVNEPCGHSFFCEECAERFREEHGDICHACREPSSLTRVRELPRGNPERRRDPPNFRRGTS